MADAIRIKSIGHAMAHCAPDVVVYDLMPPLDVRVTTAWRKVHGEWLTAHEPISMPTMM